MELLKITLSVAFLAAISSFAGPITTVPWNGHKGAVSFTFDDGLQSQAYNLTFLDDMPDAKVTFFVCTGVFDFGSDPNPLLTYALKGHEISNHTKTHTDLTQSLSAFDEISGAAKILRTIGLEASSMATPGCSQNAVVKKVIDQEHFISRSCGGTGVISWTVEPDWMEISSNLWLDESKVEDFKSGLDLAASASQWQVQLFHGVGADWYAIQPSDIQSLIEYAVQKDLWVASFSTVGAYLRAHFTLDNAVADSTPGGFKVTWASPHAHMPSSVPLRVMIQGAEGKNVIQNGKEIKANDDGSYTIEFMALELEVSGVPVKVRQFNEPNTDPSLSEDLGAVAGSTSIAQNIVFNKPVMVRCQIFDLNGELVKSATVVAESAGEAWNNVKAGLMNGTYVMRYSEVNSGKMRIIKVRK
jgi:peptidoglycan/xylan/chitin deacetylase (PgdA/CDA1 family)